MKNKILCALLGLGLCLASLTGCGNNTEEVQDVNEEQPEAAPLYVYTWDENLTSDIECITKDDAILKERIEIIVIDKTQYQAKLEEIMNNPETEKQPDIYMLDDAMIGTYLESDKLISLNDEIEESVLSDMYPYTLIKGTDSEGRLKVLTNEINPKAFIYRKSLAESYLGVKDAVDMQSFVKDWETFTDTARHVKRSSDNECLLISSVDSLDGICSQSENIVVALNNEKLTAGFAVNSDQDYKAIANGKVMAYFGDYDFIKNTLTSKCGGKSAGAGSYGDWAVCEGPEAAVSESPYIGISDSCSDKEACIGIVKKLMTESSIMDNKFKEGYLVNNIKYMNNQLNAGKGKEAVLGSDDCLKALLKQAERIKEDEAEREDTTNTEDS